MIRARCYQLACAHTQRTSQQRTDSTTDEVVCSSMADDRPPTQEIPTRRRRQSSLRLPMTGMLSLLTFSLCLSVLLQPTKAAVVRLRFPMLLPLSSSKNQPNAHSFLTLFHTGSWKACPNAECKECSCEGIPGPTVSTNQFAIINLKSEIGTNMSYCTKLAILCYWRNSNKPFPLK